MHRKYAWASFSIYLATDLQQFLLESDRAVAGNLLFTLLAVDLDVVVTVPLSSIAFYAHATDFLKRVSLSWADFEYSLSHSTLLVVWMYRALGKSVEYWNLHSCDRWESGSDMEPHRKLGWFLIKFIEAWMWWWWHSWRRFILGRYGLYFRNI